MSENPRLRGSSGAQQGPWPVGQVPDEILYELGKRLVHCYAIGRNDLSGDDFGDMFAAAIKGTHYDSPVGLTDVDLNDSGWSVKTVKSKKPVAQSKVRLISGRNSPDYSFGISEPRADIQKTGGAVLAIWNSRLNASRRTHPDMRVLVLIRNMDAKEFVLFEDEARQYVPGDYAWQLNKNCNIQGHRVADDRHCFTWQFHGGQFTIIRDVPGSARRFRIKRNVPSVSENAILQAINYQKNWLQLD